jgi:hypothetical protein
LVGVAVKVTAPPLQIEVVVEAMDTDGITDGVVVMLIALLVAFAELAQGSLLVITTVTMLPLARDDVVKVEAVCPTTFTPLIIHW